jgi:hypothetical protein
MKELDLPWAERGKPTSVVIYKKTKTSKKYYMIVTDIHIDVLIDGNTRKPIIDHKYEIVEAGIGSSFIKKWSDQYKIKKPEIITK